MNAVMTFQGGFFTLPSYMTGAWEVPYRLCKSDKFYFDFFVLLLKEKKNFDNFLTNTILYDTIFSSIDKISDNWRSSGNHHMGIRDLQSRPSGQYLRVSQILLFLTKIKVFRTLW